jgi:hypothetical protein
MVKKTAWRNVILFLHSQAAHKNDEHRFWLCCKKYFEASEVVRGSSLRGDLKEAGDELRLAHHVIPT